MHYSNEGEELKDITQIAPGLVNAACPVEGIATAGQPSSEHIESLAAAGYRTVIDLRTEDEDRGLSEESAVRRAGMEYVGLPLAPAAEDYTDNVFDRFRQTISEPSCRPAMVHCRTAARVEPLLLASLVLDEGKSYEEARRLTDEIGARNQQLHERAVAYIDTRQGG